MVATLKTVSIYGIIREISLTMRTVVILGLDQHVKSIHLLYGTHGHHKRHPEVNISLTREGKEI